MGDREAYICAALRTPVGKHGGSLASVRADDLAAIPIKAVVERSGVDPSSIDDVILGCTNQAGEDNRNVARMALLLAGLPIEIPGQTVNRLCGSGLQAVVTAAHAVRAGEGDLFVAGGVESMTRAPYVTLKSGKPWDRSAPQTADSTVGWRSPPEPSPTRSCRSRYRVWTARVRAPEGARRSPATSRPEPMSRSTVSPASRPRSSRVGPSPRAARAASTTARPRSPSRAKRRSANWVSPRSPECSRPPSPAWTRAAWAWARCRPRARR